MAHTQPLPEVELYRLIRSQIEFEATLITQRLSWFVASQSFLFTAYAITLNASPVSVSGNFHNQQQYLYHLIPMVAIATGALIYLALLAGLQAQRNLRIFLTRNLAPDQLTPFPPIQGARQTNLLGMAAPLGLPIVFIAVWTFLWTRGMNG